MNDPVTESFELPKRDQSPPDSVRDADSTIAEGDARGSSCSASAQRGVFRILKEHARGGLGTVSVAVDARLKRHVALKQIRPDRLDNPQLRERFIAEAEITGMLEHPGVVPIYVLAEDEGGFPYYAMRLIQGRTLGEAVREFHGWFGRSDESRSGGGSRFTTIAFRELLQRFVQVCQTIAYAHSKGIVHRDLKPVNIMLGHYGESLVLDWGLAKRLGREDAKHVEACPLPRSADALPAQEGLTQAGHVLGTPAYMSPEQAEGREVGPASDVYALGAVLHEILTGRPPYEGRHAADVLEQVRSGPPVDLERVGARLPSPLAAICRKAMARDAAQRYPDATDLARDVDRWLADEPVSAAKDPPSVRVRRWARKRPRIVAGMAAALLVSVVGLALGLAAVERERKQTVSQRDQKDRALAAETLARTAQQQARERTMAALRSLTDELVERQLARGSHLTDENKLFLRMIIKHFEDFADITADDVESRAIRAEGFGRVGNIRLKLGESAEAESAFRNALALTEKLARESPNEIRFRRELGACHNNLGCLFAAAGQLQEAERAFSESLAIRKQSAGDFPDQHELQMDLAISYSNLSGVLQDQGRLTDAEAMLNAALSIGKQLAADYPAQPLYGRDLAYRYNNLGILLRLTGRPVEAENAYHAALEIRKRLTSAFPNRPEFHQDVGTSHLNLALIYYDSGRFPDAEAAFGNALTILRQLATDFPAQPDYRDELAMCLGGFGNLYRDTGRFADAEATYRAAIAIRTKLVQDFPTQTRMRKELGNHHGNLGILLRIGGRLPEAEAADREALAVYQQLAADFPNQPEFQEGLAKCYSTLANLLYDTGRLSEAEVEFRRAIALQGRLAAAFPSQLNYGEGLAHVQGNLGNLLRDTGRLEEAEANYRESLKVYRQMATDFPQRPEIKIAVVGGVVNQALLDIQRRDFAAALARLEEARPYLEFFQRSNSQDPRYQRFQLLQFVVVANASAGSGNQAAAVRAAESIQNLGWNPPANTYDAACALARCIPIVEHDSQVDAPQRQATARFYGDRAMAMLRDAIAKGFKDAALLQQDPDLAVVRQRDDFQQLLAELNAPQE